MRQIRLRLVTTVLALASVAGCTSSGTGGETTTHTTAGSITSKAPQPGKPSPPDVAGVDATQPELVAETVAVASVTWDTTTQESEYAAIRQVAGLMTPELAATYQPVQGNPATDPQWAEARNAQAYNVPEVYTAQDTHVKPADTATTLYRAYEASWTWYGSDNQVITDSRTRLLYLTLTLQADGRWLVSTFDVTDLE